MSEKDLILQYLKDADEVIAAIGNNLNKIEKNILKQGANINTEEELAIITEKIDRNVDECIEHTRDLSMICWMAGKDEKDKNLDFLTILVKNYDPFFTRIFNYITRTTAKGRIIVEFLKLFEIMIRGNLDILKSFMGRERNLADKLQNLSNQTIHNEEDQLIKRWILKIIYIYTINKNEIKSFMNLNYHQRCRDYEKDYPRRDINNISIE